MTSQPATPPQVVPTESSSKSLENLVSDAKHTSVVTAATSTTLPSTNNVHKDSSMVAAAIDLETYLHQTLNLCNKLAKTNLGDPDLTNPEGIMGPNSEVAAAKMLNYCIRMLHADGWHPPTVIRAMVLRECGLEAGMKTTLYKALRERREEIKVGEAKRAGLANESMPAVVKEVKKSGSGSRNGGKNAGRRGAAPGRGRKSRAMTASGVETAANVDAEDVLVDGGVVHQVSGEGIRNGPFMSLI